MSLFRPDVDRMVGYIPGEQPQDSDWIKLNTNENPYPPSPAVVEAIQRAAGSRLNLYPDPLAKCFREVAAPLFDVDPDWILPGNGSDENLTMLMRTFVDPGESIAFPYPSYILYGTLAEIQGANFEHLPLRADWSFNTAACQPVVNRSKIVFIPNPNSPSGNRWSHEEVLTMMPARGLLVVDEAYGDFARPRHEGELLKGDSADRIVLTRTLSKSYSLAGIRFGFAVAHPDLIFGMRKVKDSYNCDAVSLAAATAALQDQDYMLKNAERIRATRSRLELALTEFGFNCIPSEANFVWCTHPEKPHETIFNQLKSEKILIRFMKFPGAEHILGEDANGLRITIGTDEEIDRLISVLRQL